MASIIGIAVFRDRDTCLAGQLSQAGIEILSCPLIAFYPLSEFENALRVRWGELSSGGAGYFLFTSVRAVSRFSEIIGKTKHFTRAISVGPATTAALRKIGIDPKYRIEMGEKTLEGQGGVWQIIHSRKLNPLLHIRPLFIDSFLEKQLAYHGYRYEPFPVYKTVWLQIEEEIKKEVLKQDYLFFTSGSTVESFRSNFQDRILEKKFPSALWIGKNTQKTYRLFFPEREGDILLSGHPGQNLSERIIQTVIQSGRSNSG